MKTLLNYIQPQNKIERSISSIMESTLLDSLFINKALPKNLDVDIIFDYMFKDNNLSQIEADNLIIMRKDNYKKTVIKVSSKNTKEKIDFINNIILLTNKMSSTNGIDPELEFEDLISLSKNEGLKKAWEKSNDFEKGSFKDRFFRFEVTFTKLKEIEISEEEYKKSKIINEF